MNLLKNILDKIHSLPARSNLDDRQTIIEGNDLFQKATKSIKITTGNLSREFYEDAGIVKSIRDAIARGVVVEIIEYLGSKKNEKWKKPILDVPGVRYWQTNKPNARHMLIVDNKHVRIEHTHESETLTPALIVKNAPKLALEYEKKFETLINEAEEQR